jgi:hypothetical protein
MTSVLIDALDKTLSAVVALFVSASAWLNWSFSVALALLFVIASHSVFIDLVCSAILLRSNAAFSWEAFDDLVG